MQEHTAERKGQDCGFKYDPGFSRRSRFVSTNRIVLKTPQILTSSSDSQGLLLMPQRGRLPILCKSLLWRHKGDVHSHIHRVVLSWWGRPSTQLHLRKLQAKRGRCKMCLFARDVSSGTGVHAMSRWSHVSQRHAGACPMHYYQPAMQATSCLLCATTGDKNGFFQGCQRGKLLRFCDPVYPESQSRALSQNCLPCNQCKRAYTNDIPMQDQYECYRDN